MNAGPWNWLEVAKLFAGLLVPIALAVFGIYVHRITKRFEHTQWRSQKLVEKRLAIYDELGPLFNDLLCYFTYVGSWRDQNPPEVVSLKRTIDKKVYLAAPLFSPRFFAACMKFQALCFETYTGWGRDARLRTTFGRRKEARADWIQEWDGCFSREASDAAEVGRAYAEVMQAFATDIGVNAAFLAPPTGNLPANIR